MCRRFLKSRLSTADDQTAIYLYKASSPQPSITEVVLAIPWPVFFLQTLIEMHKCLLKITTHPFAGLSSTDHDLVVHVGKVYELRSKRFHNFTSRASTLDNTHGIHIHVDRYACLMHVSPRPTRRESLHTEGENINCVLFLAGQTLHVAHFLVKLLTG